MIEHKIDDIRIYNTNKIFDSLCREDLSGCIARWIVDNLEAEIISEIIEKNYEGFTTREKNTLLLKIIDVLENDKEQRIFYIKTVIEQYLKENTNLNIKGFTRFRLKKYKDGLETIIDNIIERYFVEKEYDEFIDLIKEYISFQDNLIKVLNIFTINDSFIYMDKNMHDISKILEERFIVEGNLKEEDKLLTILILCNPENIVWHTGKTVKNQELIKTIKQIFGNNIVFCDQCKECVKMFENGIDIL